MQVLGAGDVQRRQVPDQVERVPGRTARVERRGGGRRPGPGLPAAGKPDAVPVEGRADQGAVRIVPEPGREGDVVAEPAQPDVRRAAADVPLDRWPDATALGAVHDVHQRLADDQQRRSYRGFERSHASTSAVCESGGKTG